MNKLVAFLATEPVSVWCGLVQTAITLGVSFGLPIDAEQKAGIITLSGIVVTIIARSKTTPKTPAA